MAYQSKHTGTNIDAGIDRSSEISSIKTTVNTHTTDISSIKTTVNTHTTNISSVTTNVSNLTSTVNTINSALNGKAPMYQYSTTDIGTGASLATGTLYIVYS